MRIHQNLVWIATLLSFPIDYGCLKCFSASLGNFYLPSLFYYKSLSFVLQAGYSVQELQTTWPL